MKQRTMRALGWMTVAGALLAACGASGASSRAPGGSGGGGGLASERPTGGSSGAPSGGSGTSTTPGDPSGGMGAVPGTPAGGGSGGTTTPATAGTLTAGAWDDNQNFAFYLSYLERSQSFEREGAPAIDRADRMVIFVNDGSARPVPGATVTVLSEGREVFRAPTAADGTVLFFPSWYGIARDATLEVRGPGGVTAPMRVAAGTPLVTLQSNETRTVQTLDVALVIDTTGSMSDEIEYLKTELDAIAGSVRGQFPGVRQRWALVVYRDEGDEYVTRSFDFTEDLNGLRARLREQSAGGGGDFPEALDEGLRVATTLSWSEGAAGRVAFLIADAPHHAQRVQQLESALRTARTRGVHVYPVASSGIDEMTEHSLRTTAQVTGGRYLFLTNDSGVGGSHIEPTLPCYFVTRLDRAMVRMLRMEVTGVREEPAVTDVIRVGGDPREGRCRLSNGTEVQAF